MRHSDVPYPVCQSVLLINNSLMFDYFYSRDYIDQSSKNVSLMDNNVQYLLGLFLSGPGGQFGSGPQQH
jgi:hypothetical protein